jgi:hypothetical protein
MPAQSHLSDEVRLSLRKQIFKGAIDVLFEKEVRLGQKRTWRLGCLVSALPPKADYLWYF